MAVQIRVRFVDALWTTRSNAVARRSAENSERFVSARMPLKLRVEAGSKLTRDRQTRGAESDNSLFAAGKVALSRCKDARFYLQCLLRNAVAGCAAQKMRVQVQSREANGNAGLLG